MYTINSNMEIMKTETVRCNPASYSYDAIKLFLRNNSSLLEDYLNDDDNRSIAFHECGYNRKAQDEFVREWFEKGVRVFQKKEDKKGQQFHTVVFFQTKIPQAYSLSAPKKTFIHILYISTKTNNSTQKLKFLEDFYGRKEDKKVDLSVDIIPIKGYNINIT